MPSATHVIVCYCTCPDADSAQRIADALVSESLAACVSRLPGVQSTYRWEGKLVTEQEVLLMIKTTGERFDAMRTRLLTLHPYDVPELIAMPVENGHQAYLDWVRNSV